MSPIMVVIMIKSFVAIAISLFQAAEVKKKIFLSIANILKFSFFFLGGNNWS